ncbi:MAG: sigma-54-dependent Fis family transcriptional regulator [Candidatus Riflebacteria bacterium]|nr:sigma-54-dependent Fis family transcriptional regulator [Candidatus Riflebacteria bacterium]
MEKLSVLIIDDEKGARFAMRRALEKEGYQLQEATDGGAGIDRIKAGGIDLVFLDFQMPGMDGMTALGQIMGLASPPLVVMVTAFGSEKLAVEAIKRGAYDYVAKPYDVEELRLLVKRAAEQATLRQENLRLKAELSRVRGFGNLLGSSEAMRKVFDKIEKVSPTEVTVLICGASGTGKELVAKAIHAKSPRSRGPFVVFDCSNVDRALIRSELFGHEKGAYTGAETERAGSFERASGGTLFLDEVGELDLELQPRLLRVLETREVLRLGAEKPRKVDVRLILATNRDLARMVAEGTFREDLYHRLSVVNLALPPLRERPEDIPLLACRFLEETSERLSRPFRGITQEALALLMQQPWTGNVRQLRNAIESAAVLAEHDLLAPEDFPTLSPQRPASPGGSECLTHAPIDTGLPFKEAKQRLIVEFERRYITAKLMSCQGNISKAARELGMHRQSLQQKLRALGIKEPVE